MDWADNKNAKVQALKPQQKENQTFTSTANTDIVMQNVIRGSSLARPEAEADLRGKMGCLGFGSSTALMSISRLL